MKICPGSIPGYETAMTIKHQSPFKEGEVSEIQNRLMESFSHRHAENMAKREAYRDLFGGDWLEQGETVGADLDEDGLSSDLDGLLDELPLELPAIPHTMIHRESGEYPAIESGLFAGEPSYSLQTSSRSHLETREAVSFPDKQIIPRRTDHPESGVNAKSNRSKRRGRPVSTPSRAGLIANFHLNHAERVVAISKLHPDFDHDQIEILLKTDAFIQKLVQEYQGAGELPGWAKFVSPEIKQFFRIFRLCTKPDAKTITIRLDHKTAEAALAAPRGPANYLAAIIKRTLTKLGIQTELAFNLEFNHTGNTENHPLHIHGTLCISDDRVHEASEALRKALADGYRQRYTNLAAHIEKPRSAYWWAAYCIKEYGITASRLGAERERKSRPDHATQNLTQEAKAFYEGIAAWLIASSNHLRSVTGRGSRR